MQGQGSQGAQISTLKKTKGSEPLSISLMIKNISKNQFGIEDD
jgi:hypothetical protein